MKLQICFGVAMTSTIEMWAPFFLMSFVLNAECGHM